MERVFIRVRPLVIPTAILALLEVWARTIGIGSDSIAPPTSALRSLATSAMDGSLLSATSFTLGSAGLGLLLASVGAILLGTLLGLSRRAAHMGALSIDILRPVPSVALIPLAMLIYGFGVRMEVSVVAFATFWPMLLLTQSAVRQVDPRLLEVARALQLTPVKRFVSIVLPFIVPRLFVALRLGVAISLVVAVTVEIAANPYGMGYALIVAQQSLDPAQMFAWLLWIGVVGYAVNDAALRIQRRVALWMGEVPK